MQTNLSSGFRARGETLGLPVDPVTQVAVIVFEPEFRLIERAGTRATLTETDGLDETRKLRVASVSLAAA